MPTVADLRVHFSADVKEAVAGIRRIENQLDHLQSKTKKGGGFNLGEMFNVAGGNLLASGIQTATSAVMGFGRAAAGVFADIVQSSSAMNAQISGIGAVLQLTGEEIKQVKGLINELGVDPNLKVNATEAADAIDMLARNGLNLEQIMGGAARATVFLANATGGSFESSANVATSVMQMFGIEAENMMDAVNGITSVTVASKFSLDDYSLAISQAGGVASSLGVEFEDFNTSIAATSSLFASGSDAGTSFKTFMQRLVPSSNEAMDAMAKLGLYSFSAQNAVSTLTQMGVKPLSNDMGTLTRQLMETYAATHKVNLGTEAGQKKFATWAKETGVIQNAFYDANGQLKSMADVSAMLNEATADLTEEQKNQYLTTIFGSDAMRTAFGLADAGQVVYTDLKQASKELGLSQEELSHYIGGGITQFEILQAQMRKTDAFKSAETRVDNLAGDMEIFSGVVESVKNQIGDNLEPSLRTLFQSMTAGLNTATPTILAWADALGDYAVRQVENLQNRLASAQTMFATASTFAPDFSAWAAGIGEFAGADVTVDAKAKIVDVDWLSGGFTHHYDATAGISVTSILWGAWKQTYDSKAQIEVTSILWGAWKTSYDAAAKISVTEVLWGAWQSAYNATAQIGVTNILWGGWKSELDATANISVTEAGWGAWTHTYNANAKIPTVDSVLWGAFTIERDVTGKIVGVYLGDGATVPTIPVTGNLTSVTPPVGGVSVTVTPKAEPSVWSTFWAGFSGSMTPLPWEQVFGFGKNEKLDFDITQVNWADVFNFQLEWSPSVPTRLTWDNVFNFSLDWFPKITWPNPPGWVTWLMGGGASQVDTSTGTHSFSRGGSSSNSSSSGGGWWPFGNNASGTSYWKGGWTWVGEKGPELINLPRGAQVFSNSDSMGMVGQLASGTTKAPTGGNFFDIVQDVAGNMGKEAEEGVKRGGERAAKKIRNEMEAAAKKMRSEMESALQGVPGLFNLSPVTQQQMDMAALGVPQNFADDYVRRLTDEVINGVDWEGVDISDAAARAGIDPNLPAKVILEMFKGKWADSSLFAGGANTDLINQQAVQDFLAQQAAQKSGKDAIMALFGVTPEEAQGQAVALGTSLRSGVEQGLATTATTGAAGATSGILSGLTTVDPAQLATVGTTIVDGLVTEMGKDEYGDKIGAVFTQMFTGFLERKEALVDVSAAVMKRITESLGNIAGIDMVGRFATAFGAQLSLPDSISKLHDVGARILEYVFQGYEMAAKERDWPAATVQLSSTPAGGGGTTTTGGKSSGQGKQSDTSITNVFYVNSEIDYNKAAYAVADIIQKRGGRR